MRISSIVCLSVALAACGGGGGGSAGDGIGTNNPPGGGKGGDPSASALATNLGREKRLLVGLGGVDANDVQSLGLSIDLFDRYLPDSPGSSWVKFNSPDGAYVNEVAAQAESVGALPMFTLYQMAYKGNGDLSLLDDRALMQAYWQKVVLLFDRLALYNKPAVVNFEPDFWGYAMAESPNADPSRRAAWVNVAPDCASLPNTVVGVAHCLLAIARKRAPKAAVGFPPSDFGKTDAEIIQFMNRVGAAKADFIVKQTLDVDAGCFEPVPPPPYCSRGDTNTYWDASNTTHPNFHDHFAQAKAWHEGIGGLPLLWWQTPMGVPSSIPGGTPKHWRDNRVDYFLRHPEELVAVGGVAVVFSGGDTQTDLSTDGGQFKTRLNAYLADPAPLP